MDAQNVINLVDTRQVSGEDPLPGEQFPAWWIGVSCEFPKRPLCALDLCAQVSVGCGTFY